MSPPQLRRALKLCQKIDAQLEAEAVRMGTTWRFRAG